MEAHKQPFLRMKTRMGDLTLAVRPYYCQHSSYTLCPKWSEATIQIDLNTKQLDRNIYHFHHINHYLFKANCTSFNKTGSSYNLAADWDIFKKFGRLTDADLLRTTALSNWNWKLIRNVNGRPLENFNDVITTPPMVRFTWNLLCGCKMRYRWQLAG